ncbi:MAG: hypothetical protein ACP5M0_14110 [Desulfomonilaceae bacterium]
MFAALGNRSASHEFLSPRRTLLLAIAALILNALCLLPLMNTPFLGDDSWCESTIRGFAELTNTSLGQLWWAVEKDYVRGGRWYPLVAYYYPLFYFATREVYKALVIALILVNVLQFGALVKGVTRSASMALMAMLMPPLFFQLRLYHDPILSYYGLMQVETAFILGSLSCFLKYLRSNKPAWLMGSAALYGLNLLTYEAFYGVLTAYVVLAYHQWGRSHYAKIAKALAPFVALATVNLLVMMALRALGNVRYQGNQLNLDPWVWGATLARQAFGALALSYFATFKETLAVIYAALSPTALVFTCVASAALFLGVWRLFEEREQAHVASKDLRLMALLGLILWLMPCVIVSGATKYQQELKWGLAYLPVYVSYFGVIMALLASLEFLAQRLVSRPRLRSALALGLATSVAGVFVLNHMTNLFVVDAYRNAELRPRQLVETALKNGLFRSVPTGAYVICGLPIRPWDTPAFYKMHSGRSVQIVRVGALDMDDQLCTLHIHAAFGWLSPGNGPRVLDFEQRMRPRPVFAGYTSQFDGWQGPILQFKRTSQVTSAPPDVFLLRYSSRDEGSGIVVLGKIMKLKAGDERVVAAAARNVTVFVECREAIAVDKIKVRGQLVNLRTLTPGSWFVADAADLSHAVRNPDGIIFSLESKQPGYGIEPRSISVGPPCSAQLNAAAPR